MNLSEMKQELMELQDFVDEYSQINIDSDDDVKFAAIEYPHIELGNDGAEVGDITEEITNDKRIDTGDVLKEIINDEKPDAGDVFEQIIKEKKFNTGDVLEEIISNSSKSYAEKSDLIKKMVPDVASLLVKDCTMIEDCRKLLPVNRNSTAINDPPRIKELFFTIPLSNLNAVTSVISETNNTAQRSLLNNKLEHNAPAKIIERRNTSYPSFANNSAKRKVPIIDAPHMPKRRKSISFMPESSKRQSKVSDSDSKWISKTVKPIQKKRSKEEKGEIKTKLAALVSKDKVPEVKIIRPNKNIPIKCTVKTRSDFLTDSIVKTMSSPASKEKINESLILPEATRRFRATRSVSNDAPLYNSSHTARTYQIAKRDKKTDGEEISNRTPIEIPKTATDRVTLTNSSSSYTSSYRITKKITQANLEALECIHNGTNNQFPDVSRLVKEYNNTTVIPSTSPAVKSILKKPNSIQKRRVTVTFVDDYRPTTAKTTTTTLTKIDEESCDDVIHNIMSLGMAALKQTSNAIPINGKNFAYNAVADQYETLKHLQK